MVLALVALGAMVLAAMPARAGSTTKTYEVAAPLRISTADPQGITADGTRDVGGVAFTPEEFGKSSTVHFRVLDLVNPFGQVYLSICQNPDGDTICGESANGVTQMEDEPAVRGCVGGGLKDSDPKLTMTGVSKQHDIIVFVDLVEDCGLGEPGGASSGQVKASW